MNYFLHSLKTTEKLVFSILKNTEKTRGDDHELLLEVWEMQGLHLTDEQKKMFRLCIPAETITRARRAIQEMGFYRPSQQVYQERMNLSEDTRKNI
jgi:hypothetical protein